MMKAYLKFDGSKRATLTLEAESTEERNVCAALVGMDAEHMGIVWGDNPHTDRRFARGVVILMKLEESQHGKSGPI